MNVFLSIFADDNQNYIIMKRIIFIVLSAVVLTLVPATYANAQWKDQGDFSEGLAWVRDANGKHGYIDKKGKVVIPCQWNVAGPFSKGLTEVKDANGKWHQIDKTGKIVKSF